MGVLTLRLNGKEEKILKRLQHYYDTDKSKVLKEAMMEKYEDLRDHEIIEEYEKNSGKVQFETADHLISKLKNKSHSG